ncbi:ABC transporter ATP-binding protein [Paenibacillus rubinfantis]|uniref:ABC transporter ATP-binding protein n=1 Tax=Paenibacillus rubinfantis TaxID=1720296 RepID=UPI00073E9126
MLSIIQLDKIDKSFRGNLLFEQASASFESGRIYGIIGHNGAGKSVLFKMICGFIKPDRGLIHIDPKYRAKRSSFPRNFGVIIDRPGYIPGRSGFDNLKKLADIQRIITDKEITDVMQRVGLDPESKQKVKHYSLGMKQKLALAQAIMENQEVLLLDEPFNGLDQASVSNIRDMMLEYKKVGKTILLTSHNKEDIDLLSDHVYQINQRKLDQLY